MPDDNKARERLAELEASLRQNNFFYAADAFKRFLEGKAKTLDEAFGVKRRKPRGRPRVRSGRHLEIAWKLYKFKSSPKAKQRGAVTAFEQNLAAQYHLSDARKVREIYERKFPTVARHVILRRMRESDARKRTDLEQRSKLQMRAIRKQISKAAKQRGSARGGH